VLLADDHAIVRRGLEQLLATADDVDVVGSAADGEQAIALAYERAPDVVVMDLEMPRVGRPSCCRASGRRPTASRRCTHAPPAPS
jgi:DNA-binding NarL/FixJ family response regulator